VILIAVVVMIAMGTLAWATLVRTRKSTIPDDAWMYPGSEIVVDTKTPDGRAIHLRTGDSLDKVVAWYTTRLKPAKIMKLTDSSVVLRNGNVTITLVGDDNLTNILVKETSP
jgi:hypothetical protein